MSFGNGAEIVVVFVLWFLMVLAFLSIPIITALWVYKDATRRGDPQAVIWAVGSAIAWPVILIVYLIVRGERRQYPQA